MDPGEALRDAVRRYGERVGQLGAELDAARHERDDAIRAAHRAGLSTREIARIARLSQQRVSQVLRGV